MDQNWLENNKADIENRNWEKYPLSLAERAAMMVVDMEGRVKAMANYPTFDLNAMVEGGPERAAILTDTRNVLMNYNIHARGTPGSIFKMVSSLGAMLEGELYTNETISDEEAMEAFFLLCRCEGIIPAVESSHAVAYAIRYARTHNTGSILACLSGRGDKDIDFVAENYGYGEKFNLD